MFNLRAKHSWSIFRALHVWSFSQPIQRLSYLSSLSCQTVRNIDSSPLLSSPHSYSSVGYHSTWQRKSQPTQSFLPTTHSLPFSHSSLPFCLSSCSNSSLFVLPTCRCSFQHDAIIIIIISSYQLHLMVNLVHLCSPDVVCVRRLVCRNVWIWICRYVLLNMTTQPHCPPTRTGCQRTDTHT